jgi:hypothetical protein
VAQITTNGDVAVELRIGKRTVVETVSSQRRLGLALWTVLGPITGGVRELFEVLLDGTGKRV